VVLPFDRERLKTRNAIDSEQERAASERRSPVQSFVETLELCEVVGRLASATGSEPSPSDLEAKARLYVRPLRVAMGS
jgi:hypothetical protein